MAKATPVKDEDKYKGNYWQFSVLSNNLLWMVLTLLFGIAVNIYLFSTDGLKWWQILSYAPCIGMCLLNYKSWKENKNGTNS